MSDEALAGGVDAPAEQPPAPPNPVESRAPVKEQPDTPESRSETDKADEKPKKSLAESIKAADARARAKAEEGEAKPKPVKAEQKTDAKPADKSGDDKPAQDAAKPESEPPTEKPTTAFKDPPRRFDDGAKSEWESVPESVRGATHRTIREIEQGLERYQQAFEPYKQIDAKLKETGQSLQEVVGYYSGIEDLLRRDPIGGLDTICRNLGSSLREVAEKVLGQTPDEHRAQSDQTINGLRGEINQLKNALGQVTGSVKQQMQTQAMNEINAFAETHPRFDELSETIAAEIDAGHSLKEAYRRAELLNPAPVAPVQTRSETIQPKAEVQTLKGSKSVSGSPRSGQTPAKAKPGPSSIREAIERASARAG